MWLELFFRGLIIGFIASVPCMGPAGILAIQRTLSKSQKSGFISGLGAASGDTLYATIAFFSVSVVTNFIEQHMLWIKLIAGAFIIIAGALIFFSNPAMQIRRNRSGKSNLWQDFLSDFLVTLANPSILIMFMGFFAMFGVSNDMGEVNGTAMLVGVFAGAAVWWFLLTLILNIFRKKIRPRHLLWINRIAGIIIAVIGLAAILSALVNIQFDGILR